MGLVISIFFSHADESMPSFSFTEARPIENRIHANFLLRKKLLPFIMEIADMPSSPSRTCSYTETGKESAKPCPSHKEILPLMMEISDMPSSPSPPSGSCSNIETGPRRAENTVNNRALHCPGPQNPGVSIASIRTGLVCSAVIFFLLSLLDNISWAPETGGPQPLKVFLLAGQSNMVGQGSMKHLDLLVQDDDQREFREALWNGTSYNEREDVFITYKGHHGKLTAGRKSGFAGSGSFGPELMFGWTVGDAFPDERILLIKTAWGGKSLAVDFRPPSSGDGTYTGDLQPSSPDGYGIIYREMIANILDSLDNIGTVVPDYNDEAGYTVEGFVWFQGWNDMLHVKAVKEYAFNLRNLINDVRLDLDLPNLPFGKHVLLVVGQCLFTSGTIH